MRAWPELAAAHISGIGQEHAVSGADVRQPPEAFGVVERQKIPMQVGGLVNDEVTGAAHSEDPTGLK